MRPDSHSRCTRREFLGKLGASAMAVGWSWPVQAATPMHVKIAKVESFPCRYPVVGRFKFFEGPPGQPSGRPAVVVKLTADNGAVGWGQSVPIPKWSYETLETVHSTLTRHLAPELIGRDPFDIEGIHAAMNRAVAPSFSTGQPICKAGVDLALFDLTGRLLQQSAAQRWNRKGRDRLTLSWTLNPRQHRYHHAAGPGRQGSQHHAPAVGRPLRPLRRARTSQWRGHFCRAGSSGFPARVAHTALRRPVPRLARREAEDLPARRIHPLPLSCLDPSRRADCGGSAEGISRVRT